VADDEWIAYGGAVALVGDEGAVLRALKTGAIKSRGLNNLLGEEEDIPAGRWGQWTFLPTFKGAVPEWMRAAAWLVPPGKEVRRICCGFKEIRLLRADVERLAPPPAIEPEHSTVEQPPAKKSDLAEKELKLDVVVAALKRLFPTGRKHHKQDALKAAVEKDLGYEVSLATVKRAMPSAWPVAQAGSK
jgi:hypothetical protein